MATASPDSASQAKQGSALEVFRIFGRLGVTSFGGPVAHLGYFRAELVEGRKWMSDRQYADLVALAQFLPGPVSSQVGFGMGLYRAGFLGALAAFVAFTLPSAIALVLFAYGATLFDGPIATGIILGLKIVAVAIVAQAVLGMGQKLAPDKTRMTLAVLATIIVLLSPSVGSQIVVIVLGALLGLLIFKGAAEDSSPPIHFPVSKAVGMVSLALFFVVPLIVVLVANFTGSESGKLFDAFYRSGALVFGGGHVVLPLLQTSTVGNEWMTNDAFLAGYGAAQAVPGPLFTFAAYLGAVSSMGPGGVLGATIALIAIFLPGFLLLIGILPFWNKLRQHPRANALTRGANAAVVGILLAALYDPVFTSAVKGPASFSLALVCFLLLMKWKMRPWMVVLFAALGGVLIHTTGLAS